MVLKIITFLGIITIGVPVVRLAIKKHFGLLRKFFILWIFLLLLNFPKKYYTLHSYTITVELKIESNSLMGYQK